MASLADLLPHPFHPNSRVCILLVIVVRSGNPTAR
uniref:Uncharacterized protein n=1 Tax=Arundo donax TaxID=35708 RepID=A0A0A8Y8B5_ARUDO